MKKTEPNYPLSKTGAKWVMVMGRIFDAVVIGIAWEEAARITKLRGGRLITSADLNQALNKLEPEIEGTW